MLLAFGVVVAGAIYTRDSLLVVKDSRLQQHWAYRHGGAVYAANNKSNTDNRTGLILYRSRLYSNFAQGSGGECHSVVTE